MGEKFEEYKERKLQERRSRLCRMAGNIAAGIAIFEEYDIDGDGQRRVTRYLDTTENIARNAVAIAVAIDAEVARVTDPPTPALAIEEVE